MRSNAALASITCILILSACELLRDSGDFPESLDFEQVQYTKYGGWINTFKLSIHSSGAASAELIGHGSGQVIDEGTAILSAKEREHLATLLASFPKYRRSYEPETYYTDGNTHEIVVHYGGIVDTVWTYNPFSADIPRSLEESIKELERIHQRIIPQHP